MRGRGRRTGAHSHAGRGGYVGARHSREFENWLVKQLSADADLLPDREELIARSRDLCRNNAFARGVLETMVNEIVGCGIRPQCTVDPTEPLLKEVGLTKARARKLKQTTQRDWRRWGRKADVTGRNTIGELQAQIMGKILEDGDVFVHFERVELPGRGYWLAVNVIEAHRVSTPVSKAGGGTPA